MKKIKIIHIQLFPLMSGVQKVSFDELSNLDSNLFERIVICKSEGEFTRRLQEIGVRVYLVPELRREISPVNDFFAFLHLRAFLTKELPDIVHTHSSKTGFLGRLAARAANVRSVVHTVHGYSFASQTNPILRFIFMCMERIAAFACDKIVVLNLVDANISTKILRISNNKLIMIPNGVDANVYSPPTAELRRRLRMNIFGISDNSHCIIGMVGRLSVQKNPHCFLRAALALAEQYPNTSFVLIGDGELRSEMEYVISGSAHSDRVSIIGWREDIADVLRALDVMVLPSRWEGMPLAILESMAVGVPVIASDIPGNNNLVCDGVNGRLFPSNDAVALAQSIEEFINDPQMRWRYSEEARAKVLVHYSLINRMQEILTIYKTCLNRRSL